MKKMVKLLKSKMGYISIETVIVAGLMLMLGYYILNALAFEVNELASESIDVFHWMPYVPFETVPGGPIL